MLDQPTPLLERSRGRALAAFHLREGRTRLADLSQQGSAKILLPRSPAERPEVVFLNTSGGLTGGDRLDLALDLGPGTRLAATTQTAERAYLSRHGPAHVRIEAKVGPGAVLHWLPQETILFQDSDLQRDTTIDLAADAGLILCESLTLGRQAMGETLTRAALTDRRLVRRAGRPLWTEGFALSPATLARPQILSGARALGVLGVFARGAEDLGQLPRTEGVRLEASGWDGRTLVRIAADSGFALRRQMAALITHLTGALPRVWSSGGTP